MKRFFCVLILIVTGFSFLAAAPLSRLPGSSVWRIRKNGNTLFLGGSIHVLRTKDFPLPREFDEAFSCSSMLVLEADTKGMEDGEVLRYLLSRMFLPEGQTLETILEPEIYEALMAECEQFGMVKENLIRLKPSMVIMMLSALELQKSGFVEEGVDFYFADKAKAKNMPIDFFEDIETQIDLIVTMGDGYEDDFVRYSLEDMGTVEQEEELEVMVEEWKNGDSTDIESDNEEMKTEWPLLYKYLILDRNNAWMFRMEEYLTTSPVEFIIVGAAHLHGPDGLLQKLKDSGCFVEQFQ